MDSPLTDKLAELLSGAPDSTVLVDLHREPVVVTLEPQD
jgi:hypothetical protein